jgi:predicted RNase H-like HicB family nuclease
MIDSVKFRELIRRQLRAYCPDLPGLGVVGEWQDEVERLIREAIGFHLQGLPQAGEPIPAA